MANKYYTLEQVCEILGVTPDDVKTMGAEGRLREIRDAGKIFYRIDEVDRLRTKEGSSVVDLASDDGGGGKGEEAATFAEALSSLADSSSDLGLLDAGKAGDDELSDIPEQLPAAPAGSIVDDFSSEINLAPLDEGRSDKASLASAEAVPDLGLSGTDVIKLETADEVAPKKPKEDSRVTAGPISVFDDEDLDIESDPMGKTHIAPAVEDFDAAGGGSGLLDLPRESDDTSLGSELLDVISPSEADTEDATAVEESPVEAAIVDDSPDVSFNAPVAAAARRAPAAMAGAVPLNVCAGLGLVGLLLAGLATSAGLQGVWLDFLSPIARDVVHFSVFGGLMLVTLAMGILSILADRNR